MVNKHIPNLTIDVSYLNQVNRVFGPDGLPGANDGRFTGDIILANLAWQTAVGKLTGFALSGGIRPDAAAGAGFHPDVWLAGFQGERPLARIKMAYIASWATQSDHGANPLDFSNDYYLAELTGSFRQYSLGAGYEVLQGNGVKGFTTPLATLHRFQGWADKFLTTPVNGITDRYLNAGYQRKGVGPLETVSLSASWHGYRSERLDINYGSELDLQLQARFRRFNGGLKYAIYDAAASTPATVRDTRKLWAQIDFTW